MNTKNNSASEKKPFTLQSYDSMTIYEAERIINIFSMALEHPAKDSFNQPISLLRGFNHFQITTALNLRIANEFLLLKEQGGSEEEMDCAVEQYCSAQIRLVSFKESERILDCKKPEQIDLRSFYNYCEDIGSNDPIFWQKIYTKLGLRYTRLSPQETKSQPIDYSNGFETMGVPG